LLVILGDLFFDVFGECDDHFQVIGRARCARRRQKHRQAHRGGEAVLALRLGLVVAGVLGLALAAGAQLADRVRIVAVGGAVVVRREEAGEVPARGRQREHLLAAAGQLLRDERADKVGF
jgi:hypothetical protein